jgi:hypothetical protein
MENRFYSRFLSLGLAVALAFGVMACIPQEPNTLSKTEVAEGWELLFDGSSLEGWRNYNREGLEGWHVVDGAIQADGSGSDASGYIVTKKQYENFHLKCDWKLTKGGNSGIIYHVVERPEFGVPYVTGPEYQLIDIPGWEEVNAPAKLEEWQKLGVDYAMYLPDMEGVTVNPPGEWNTSEIIFDNGHVEHWLNGKKIVEFEAWTDDWFERKNSGKWADAPEYGLAHRGLVCLQDHGNPASFRNLKIKELPRKTGKEVTLFNGENLHGWVPYGKELFYVDAEGNLVVESGPEKMYGYLATREYYDDFDCTFEFKEVSDGNAGFFFRSVVFPPVMVNGWQVEIAPEGQWSGGIYESYGRGWLYQPTEEHLKQTEWNTMRVKAVGDNVTVWLNGVEVTNLTDSAFSKRQGRLALQIHDGGGIKVLFRNLKLVTL